MTDDTPTGEAEDRYRPTLGDVSHTHPTTGARFGDTQAYERGPVVAADGGARARADDDERALRDVDHEPPVGEGIQHTYERGTEGRERDV